MTLPETMETAKVDAEHGKKPREIFLRSHESGEIQKGMRNMQSARDLRSRTRKKIDNKTSYKKVVSNYIQKASSMYMRENFFLL